MLLWFFSLVASQARNLILEFFFQIFKIFQFSRFAEALHASHHLEHDRVLRRDVGDADDFLKAGLSR